MTSTTWTQTAGMDSGTSTDAVVGYVDTALAAATAADGSASSAAGSAVAAAGSETAAAASASDAGLSETAAAASETNAAASELAAAGSASASAASAIASAASATASAASAAAAAGSEALADADRVAAQAAASAASISETAAAASAANAASSAGTAALEATSAANSASSASTSAANAASSETAAATSETNAAASAVAAAAQSTEATAQALNASGSASAASASATAAAASATAAASSATSASTSADVATAALYDFDDGYLGQKASDPATDNHGNALVTGALYFNSTDNIMKVYDGSLWVAAYASLAGAVLTAGSTMTGDLSFGDNNKAIFGAGSDLQIYHDGGNSRIKDAGTGYLYLMAEDRINFTNAAGTETYANFINNGAVNLYYDNVARLATTSTGIDVTGTLNTTGSVGVGTSSPSGKLTVTDGNDGLEFGNEGVAGTTRIFAYDRSVNAEINLIQRAATHQFQTAGAERMRITSAGSVGIGTSSPDTYGSTLSVNGHAEVLAAKRFLFHNSDNTNHYYINNVGSTGAGAGVLSITQSGVGERMRITSAGSVGIGTSSPDATAQMHTSTTSTTARMIVESTSASGYSGYRLKNASGYWETQIDGVNQGLRFLDDGTERLRITSTGSVGIGTSSPSQELHVQAGTGLEADIRIAGNGGASSYLDIFHNSGSAGMWNASNTPLQFATNSTERMRIDSSGNVGIGTSSPATKLTVVGSGTSPIVYIGNGVDSAPNRQLAISETGGSGLVWQLNSTGASGVGGQIAFATNGSERMRIDSSGNVLLGTSSSIASGYIQHIQIGSGGGGTVYKVNSNGDDAVSFRNAAGTQVGYVTVNIGSVIYATSSDYRLKENVAPLTGASERVLSLKPSRFNFIVDPSNTVDGFLAHEVQAVVPEAVTGVKDGTSMQGIDHSKLVPLLTASLQEALAEIAQLKADVAALKGA